MGRGGYVPDEFGLKCEHFHASTPKKAQSYIRSGMECCTGQSPIDFSARLGRVNISHHAVVKRSEQAMCSLSASTPLQLAEADGADSSRGEARGEGTARAHPSLCSYFFNARVSLRTSAECGSALSALPHFLSLRETPFKVAAGTGLTPSDKSFFPVHGPPLSERNLPPPLQSRTRSFINASAGRTSTPPPPCSPPLHFICVLFLGPLASPFVAPPLFLISLYLAPLVLFILE